VIEKNSSGIGKHYATRLALQQPHANFGFQITYLPAEGRL
jgi:hypothetical protein